MLYTNTNRQARHALLAALYVAYIAGGGAVTVYPLRWARGARRARW